jgi:hypothetical protein
VARIELAAAAAAVLTTSPLIGAIKCHLERNATAIRALIVALRPDFEPCWPVVR